MTGTEGERVHVDWRLLADQLLHGQPASEESAKAALEWLAAREDKTLAELSEELRALAGATPRGARSLR